MCNLRKFKWIKWTNQRCIIFLSRASSISSVVLQAICYTINGCDTGEITHASLNNLDTAIQVQMSVNYGLQIVVLKNNFVENHWNKIMVQHFSSNKDWWCYLEKQILEKFGKLYSKCTWYNTISFWVFLWICLSWLNCKFVYLLIQKYDYVLNFTRMPKVIFDIVTDLKFQEYIIGKQNRV